MSVRGEHHAPNTDGGYRRAEKEQGLLRTRGVRPPPARCAHPSEGGPGPQPLPSSSDHAQSAKGRRLRVIGGQTISCTASGPHAV